MEAGSIAAVVLLVCGLVSVASAAEAWRQRDAVGRLSLAVIMAASAVWSLAYAMEAAAGSAGSREFWGTVKYLGVTALPSAWLVFTIQYSGASRRIGGRLVALLVGGPVLVMVLLALPGTRPLIRSYPPDFPGPLPPVELGPLFWPWFVYSIAVAGFATVPLVVRLLRTSQLYRRQVRMIFGAVSLVIFANLLTNIGVGVFERFDPTPVALAIGGLLLIRGVVRFRVLELLPVARTTLVETMADAVLVTDAHHRVVDLNPAAEGIVGPASTVVGRPVEDLLGAAEPGVDDSTLARRELVLAQDGTDRHFEVLLSHLDDGGAGHVGDLFVLRDITARKQAERHLEHIAHHDALTELPNRLLFADRMDQALIHARRDHTQLAVLFLDLDQFKVINDSLGHDFGDRVLVQVARRLEHSLRARDTLARLGGDEFSVILPDIAKPEDSALVAAKLLHEVAQPLNIDDQVLHVSASIGIAVFPQDGEDQRALLSRADGAMYAAKTREPGSYEFSSPEIQARAEDRQRLEGQLRQALASGELFLEYQPLVNLASGAVIGFEGLVRWAHPDLGVLPPERFLHWAEESRLVSAIDKWALGEACREAATWQNCDRKTLISVNISPFTTNDAGLPGAVADALDRSGLDPSCLCLELSERMLLDDDELIAERLVTLKSMGLSVALDDFGVGHTSLSQIRRLPLDVLKIDRSFIRTLGTEDGETPIVAAIINVAHIMGMDVLAEAIERPEQLEVLRELGCDQGQGFLFSGALSAERARAIVANADDEWPIRLGAPSGQAG